MPLFKSNKKNNVQQDKMSQITLERAQSSFSVADIIAPPAVEVNSNFIKLGEKYAKTFFILSYPGSIFSNWLSPITNSDRVLDISIHIGPTNATDVLHQLNRKITNIEALLGERERKGLIRDPELQKAHHDIEILRDNLVAAAERMFHLAIYFTIYGDTEQDLNQSEKELRQSLESQLIILKPLLFRQKEGFLTTAPFLQDTIQKHLLLNTAPVSASFPFTSFEVTSDRGVLYGINRQNNSLIIFDRFSLENANMVIFAKSGSGKSYFEKLEILRSLSLGTDVIIIDPENEYRYLTETVGGSLFDISLASNNHINPLDIPKPIEDETWENTFRSNIANLVGLMRLLLGGMTPEEDAIMDEAIKQTYALKNITTDSEPDASAQAPLLSDLEAVLESMSGGSSLAVRLHRYTKGAFAGFLNQPTNISISNRLITFMIRDLEEELRPIGIYIILRYVWNIIRSDLRKRLLVVDEAWLMMQKEDSASFLFGLVKRGRKYYLGVTTITQDVSDFANSAYGQPIVANSSLQLLLKQSPATIDTVVKMFNLTNEERYLLLQANIGEGLFFAGARHAAIRIEASFAEDQIITTNPQQLIEIQRAKEMFNR